MNLSASFILPILNLSCTIYRNGLVETYMGDADYVDDWGKYLFIEMDNSSKLLDCLRTNHLYIDSYPRTTNTTMFVFDLSDYESITKPFLEGQYSKIDRRYVNKNFPPIEGLSKSLNREILDKSPRIRHYQENRIGVNLPEDAEVWDRPVRPREIHGYSVNSLQLA